MHSKSKNTHKQGYSMCAMRRNGLMQMGILINDIKLEYLCRNKLPGIVFILMHGDD